MSAGLVGVRHIGHSFLLNMHRSRQILQNVCPQPVKKRGDESKLKHIGHFRSVSTAANLLTSSSFSIISGAVYEVTDTPHGMTYPIPFSRVDLQAKTKKQTIFRITVDEKFD